MIHALQVTARRWFEKTNGNTYHTVELDLEDGNTLKSPRAYGYGDQWRTTAKDLAERFAVILDDEALLDPIVLDVKRKKDL